MANPIDLLYAKGVKQEAIEIKQTLVETYAEVVKLSKAKIDFFGGKSPQSPADLQKVISDYDKIRAANDKNTQKIIANKEKERLAEIRLQQAREKAVDKFEKDELRKQAALARSESFYNKISAKISQLEVEYNSLAAKRNFGITLTDKEAARYDFLTSKINRYRDVLIKTDTDINKFSRKVGDYASGFNPLSSSIGRIAQELPNLGQSFQIFAMSIGNNIAAFKDAIDGIIERNKVLQAEGKATTSVMSQVAGSLFSLNTLLYVGIAVFIAYGEEIGNWVKSLFGANEELEKLQENQKKLNAARNEGLKDSVQQTTQLKENLAIAKDSALTDEERMIALKKLRSEYPLYFKHLKDSQILLGDTEAAEKAITIAINKRAEAERLSAVIVENKQKLVDLKSQLKIEDDLAKKYAEQAKNLAKRGGVRPEALAAVGNQEAAALQKSAKIRAQINEILRQNENTEGNILRLRKESIGLDYQEEKATKERVKAREKLEAIKLPNANQDGEGLIAYLEKYKAELEAEQRLLSKSNKQYEEYEKAINMVKESILGITDVYTGLKNAREKDLKSIEDNFKAQEKYAETFAARIKKTSEELKQYLNSFSEGFFDNMGFSTGFDILTNKITGFGKSFRSEFQMLEQQYQSGAISYEQYTERIKQLNKDQLNSYAVTVNATLELGQEVNDFLTQLTKNRFDAERNQLEEQYALSSALAEGNAEQQKRLDEQAAARRKDINKREAEAQKKQARFNIIVDTAQAVISELAKGGYVAALFAAALGAAQLAVVNAAEVPQYFTGTDNAKPGLAWTQEKGREIITDKKGRIKSMGSDKGAQLTPMEAGDVVYNASKTREIIQNNKALNSILSDIGGISLVGNTPVIINNGNDNYMVVDAVNNLASTIERNPKYTQVEDKSGRSLYEQRQGLKKKIANAYLTYNRG